jgi:hypothetical protein
MNLRTPKRLTRIGGILISISGVVNIILGIKIGALVYDAYPGGHMGHVGILAGAAAIVIGLLIVFVVRPLYERRHRGVLLLSGILTIVLGHLGGVAGAIYIGTAGVMLCYVSGVWLVVAAVRGLGNRPS